MEKKTIYGICTKMLNKNTISKSAPRTKVIHYIFRKDISLPCGFFLQEFEANEYIFNFLVLSKKEKMGQLRSH